MTTDIVRFFPSPFTLTPALAHSLTNCGARPLARIRLCAYCAHALQLSDAIRVTACTSGLACARCGTDH
jgi:hypothetical protein